MTQTGTAERAAERRSRCGFYFQAHDFTWDDEADAWFAFCNLCESEVYRDGLPWRPVREVEVKTIALAMTEDVTTNDIADAMYDSQWRSEQ